MKVFKAKQVIQERRKAGEIQSMKPEEEVHQEPLQLGLPQKKAVGDTGMGLLFKDEQD